MTSTSVKTSLARQTLCILALLLMATTCAWVSIMSQASSPNYKALFWGLAPFAAFHFLIVAAYFFSVRHNSRWMAFGFGTLTAMSFGEFTWRIL